MSAQPPGTSFTIRLLDGLVRVTGAGEDGLKHGCDELLAVLALAEVPVGVPRLRQVLGLSPNGLYQRVHRLDADYGVPVINDRSRGTYRLGVDDGTVDALAFLRVANTPPAERGENDTDEALSWWGAGPDEALVRRHRDVFANVVEARRLLSIQRSKRVLVVDDKVGHHIARLLRGHCRTEVVTDLEGFEDWAKSLDTFDLALVDIHLTDSYEDHQGLEIINRIVSSPTDVVVLGMTKAPVPGATRAWLRRHDLVELIVKSGDDETSDFSEITSYVRALLAAGPAAHTGRLMADFNSVIEKAVTRLTARGEKHETERLRRDVHRIHDRHIDGAPLAELRSMVRDFRADWGVEFALG